MIRHNIPIVSDFFRYFAITKSFTGVKLVVFVFLNLLSAVVESVGILIFIPFLSQLSGSSGVVADRIARFLSTLLAGLNVTVTVGAILGVLVLAFSLKGIVVFFLIAYRQRLLNQTKEKLRERLIALYAELDYRYVLDRSAGFFGNVVLTESERACVAMEGLCRAISSLITGSVFIVVAFFLHSSLNVFMLFAVGASLILLRKISARARQYSVKITSLSTRLNEHLIQTMQAFKYLKATARFSRVQSQLAKISMDNRETSNKLAWANAAVFAVQEPLLGICLTIFFYYAVVIGKSEIPSVMVSALFFYRCMIEMGHFNSHWQWLSAHAGGLDIVWNTAKEMEQHREKTGTDNPAVFNHSIELRNLSYAYGARTVLQDVNISIGKNSTVALVGASGVGKTTLVDILTGVLEPSEGTVCFDGKDIRALNLSRYRESIGYVQQETIVFNDTIANNIVMQWNQPMNSETFARVQQAARSSYCDEFIERLPEDYRTRVGERGLKLSAGQRQRLAIARELFKCPAVLILDEATSSLDSQSEAYIQQSIDNLRGRLTLIIISHRLSTIKDADFIYVIEQGRIVEQGTFLELSGLKDSAFRRMCALQRLIA